MSLENACLSLPGVGAQLAAKLAKCHIHSISDLLFHLPYRYQDRTRVTPLRDIREQEYCVIVGHVTKTQTVVAKKRTLICHVEDKTGVISLRFFHFNQHQAKAMQDKKIIRAFGEVRRFGQQMTMVHPEYQLLSDEENFVVEETLTPIYPSTQGLSQTRLRQLVSTALDRYESELSQLEWMPKDTLTDHRFVSFAEALITLHNPPPDIAIQTLESGQHPALQRIVFEELLAQQLSMAFAKQKRQALSAPSLPPSPQSDTALQAQLPFALTNAQQRVCQEIKDDLSKATPMLRLVQGDVGAGKTVIAAFAAMQAIANGYQVALMAPTDLLTEQHSKNLATWLTPLGIKVMRLSGKLKTSEKRTVLEAINTHSCQLVVGTHALFQKGVEFSKLGLVIIDEQHRFGVNQRISLHDKGKQDDKLAHQLLLTATPIPRTLSMTQFAHLDLSVLDELPPGRVPIKTAVMSLDRRDEIITRLANAVQDGRQVYWVCTLIEESESLQCQAAVNTAETLQNALPQVRVGLVHGKMKADAKDATMQAFKSGDLDLLVATTVIEVGVDVPNASLMIIENAERLGLSQLHQLRGRVGRGTQQAHCLLMYQPPLSMQGQERLQVMRDTTDGFIIAEKDMTLRGAGDFLGTRQTGYQQYKLVDLERDKSLLPKVSQTARDLIQHDIHLAKQLVSRWHGSREQYLQG